MGWGGRHWSPRDAWAVTTHTAHRARAPHIVHRSLMPVAARPWAFSQSTRLAGLTEHLPHAEHRPHTGTGASRREPPSNAAPPSHREHRPHTEPRPWTCVTKRKAASLAAYAVDSERMDGPTQHGPQPSPRTPRPPASLAGQQAPPGCRRTDLPLAPQRARPSPLAGAGPLPSHAGVGPQRHGGPTLRSRRVPPARARAARWAVSVWRLRH